MSCTATYSPEDNKLRLYATNRLDSETYARVRAAGFTWAPKQELFVAPAWTPEREDLLIELAGEVGDEDTSLVERAEGRADRFDGYQERRLDDATAARSAVAVLADNIPLGQPILVGHHSERHARKDAERIERGMRRAVKMWETAQYWKTRAAAAIRAARYKELPSVRTRRIKGLEAEQRKVLRSKAESEKWMHRWSIVHEDDSAKKPDGSLTNMLERARSLANYCHMYVTTDGRWSAWDVLCPDDERYKECPAMTPEDVQRIALERFPQTIARCNRWLAHLKNRLEYERAMLSAVGGTPADRIRPEVGGACRCWVGPRGGWAYIKRVNKVSVTILDNWGNGARSFTRTIPFDKLTALMSAAEVQAARDAGRLIDTSDSTGFILSDPPSPSAPRTTPPTNDDAAFRAMREQLRAGVHVASVPQLFPTPVQLAARMVEMARIGPGHTVLEPSAGTGRLLRAIREATGGSAIRTAVEIDIRLCDRLRVAEEGANIIHGDFLQFVAPTDGYDRVVMNPPFSDGADIEHVLHAKEMLKPGGLLVAIVAGGPRQFDALRPLANTWEDLPCGTFQGSDVRAVLLTISKN